MRRQLGDCNHESEATQTNLSINMTSQDKIMNRFLFIYFFISNDLPHSFKVGIINNRKIYSFFKKFISVCVQALPLYYLSGS